MMADNKAFNEGKHMKVYLLMTLPSKASFKFSEPKVRDVYLDRKMAITERDRLEASPYTRGYFWIVSKIIKENT